MFFIKSYKIRSFSKRQNKLKNLQLGTSLICSMIITFLQEWWMPCQILFPAGHLQNYFNAIKVLIEFIIRGFVSTIHLKNIHKIFFCLKSAEKYEYSVWAENNTPFNKKSVKRCFLHLSRAAVIHL